MSGKKVDWAAIEQDYRAGALTLREMEVKHGASPSGISKRARSEGWVRRIEGKARLKSVEKVHKKVHKPKVHKEVHKNDGCALSEDGPVETSTVLTQKQEAFCLAYIELGNASEAYRRAYDAKNMKPESINVNASKLLADTKIALRVEELRAPAAERAQVSLEKHLNDLQALRDVSVKDGKYGPAVQAEVARGKASGLYVERKEVTGADGGPILTKSVTTMTDEELLAIVTSDQG